MLHPFYQRTQNVSYGDLEFAPLGFSRNKASSSFWEDKCPVADILGVENLSPLLCLMSLNL